MEVDQQRIDQLVQAPSESLNLEVKGWIGTTLPEHQAKIVRACLALRNRNGGFLIIGFDDETLLPDDPSKRPADVRKEFHVDEVQGLISKYAQELFEIGVGFSTREEIEYPVITVPPGVQVPVASKRDLIDKGTHLVRESSVYFRTLNANGVPSTSVAHPKDWKEIVEICFENREADIGRFLRRHLAEADRNKLVEALRMMGFTGALAAPTSIVSPHAPSKPSLHERVSLLLAEGSKEFLTELENRKSSKDYEMARSLSSCLSMQVALIVDPALPERNLDQSFLNHVLSSNPNYIGWPIWVDSRRSTTDESRPFRSSNSWNSFILHQRSWSNSLDFWMLEPTRFYLWRTLQDDQVPEKIDRGVALDPLLTILRVGEAIAVGIAFARTLAGHGKDVPRTLGFGFKWSKLKGRKLVTWANPMATMIGEPQSRIDEVETYVECPIDTPINAIAPIVADAMHKLFALFDGTEIPLNVFEDRISRLLDRKL